MYQNLTLKEWGEIVISCPHAKCSVVITVNPSSGEYVFSALEEPNHGRRTLKVVRFHERFGTGDPQ